MARLPGALGETGGVIGENLRQQRGPERRLDAVAARVGAGVGELHAGLDARVGEGRTLARVQRLGRAVDRDEVIAHGREEGGGLRQVSGGEPRAEDVGSEEPDGLVLDLDAARGLRRRARGLGLEHGVEFGEGGGQADRQAAVGAARGGRAG